MSWEFPLRAVLKALALPPGLFVVLLLIAVLFWRSFFGRFLAVATAAAIYLLSTGFAAAWLAEGLETYPPVTAKDLKTQGVQAIVVLMAGRQTAAPELGGRDTVSRLSMDRLSYAVRLHRASGLPLVLSGGRAGADGPPLAELGAAVLRELFDVEPLALEDSSDNTWQNAAQTADLLEARGLKRIALVTHAWHMPRALLSFHRAGIAAIPAPTYFIHKPEGTAPGADRWSWTDWLPSIQRLLDSTLLLHEYLGGFWYREANQPGG
jgi:uncharacterized SAM-binding protein YcdF (DUF218 family)